MGPKRLSYFVLAIVYVCLVSAQLPSTCLAQRPSPEVQTDIYLVAAKKYMAARKCLKAGDYDTAVAYFKEVIDLRVNVPADFYFYYSKSLVKKDEVKKAYIQLKKYINVAGIDGKYYKDALKLLSRIRKNDKEERVKPVSNKATLNSSQLEVDSRSFPDYKFNGPKRKAGTPRTIFDIDFVWIPAGSFMKGSPSTEKFSRIDEHPQHRIAITRGFWIGKYEVTQFQWEKVWGSNPSFFKGNNKPVETVSWDDCQNFITRLNNNMPSGKFSLPSESQFEYVCRAGTKTAFCFGPSLTTNDANYDGNYPYYGGVKGTYREKTTNVGSFSSNRWGLYDVHGNVSEWCSDWYNKDYFSRTPQILSSRSTRVTRGGSWSSSANSCRSARRIQYRPDSCTQDLGFRLVFND